MTRSIRPILLDCPDRTPEDFGRAMAEETARGEKVVGASGAKAE